MTLFIPLNPVLINKIYVNVCFSGRKIPFYLLYGLLSYKTLLLKMFMSQLFTSNPQSKGSLALGSYFPAVKLTSDAFIPTNLQIELHVQLIYILSHSLEIERQKYN